MADDIDIEEHDVLESLRRRHEQPDTSIVKSEPLEIEYEESNYEEPNYEYQWEDKVEIKIEPREQTENADEFRFGKIILGSKPDRLTEENGQVTAGTSQLSEEEYNYNMSLVLEDWGPILESSDCYCKICETLFATVNALDAHRMVAHSFLVATDKLPSPERNKAFKSTAKPSNVPLTNSDDMACKICHAEFKGNIRNIKSNLCRHYRNVHRVDPKTMNSSDFKSWRVCNHCNLYFPNDTSLVKHLYELLPLNDNKSPTKDDKRTVSQPVPKPLLNVGKNTPKAVKSTTSKNLNLVNSPMKNEVTVTPQPNRIILGSKPMAISENTNSTKINLSESQTQPNKIKLTDTKVRFKCLLCSEIFTTKYGAKKHRKKHPTRTKRQHIFVKFVNKNKAVVNPYLKKEPGQVKPVVKKYASKFIKKEVAEEDKGILVSKSTLFKCNRCSVHFLTCTGACQHSIVCESSSNIRDWACPRCQRVFKSAERAAHEYQHRVLNANKFRVYVVYLEMIVRVLCQCPNCFVCFEEDKFWRHVDSGCNDAASYFCSECKLPIDIHSKANHDSKHKQGDFTRDDFIKVDYVCSKPLGVKKIETEVEARSPVKIKVERETPKGLKRKLELQEAPSRKRKKNLNDLILYYCQFCRSYIGNQSVVHLSGSCAEKTKQFVGFCHICGIHFKKKYHSTHMSWHVRCPNLVINDFTIVKLSDSKKTKPVQVLYPCKACNVNFLTKLHRFRHKCEETASTTCQICQKKIQANLFDTHWRIHNYVIPRQIKTIDDMINMPNTSQNDKKSPIKHKFTKTETKTSLTELPDLLMKYQSLTTLWNILYLCAICDTFTDSYDKVVEHCQNHLTNMENYGVVIKKCDKCNMKFDSECYKRHLELHAENKVNKKTFQILKYEHYNLFSENWFDFIDLPEEQKAQIVNRSIYGGNRCVKMKLIQQGPPEYTLYKCEKCTNCLTADNIVYHVKLANCCKANKILCSVCHMTFAIRRDCEEHEKTHESTGLDLQSFRIVSFNNSIDAEANKTIMSYDTDNHGSKSKISFIDDEPPPKIQNSAPLKSFVFYKCTECQISVAHFKNFPKHACNSSGKTQCDQCGIFYNAKHGAQHKTLHQRYSFNRSNVITKTMNKAGKVINIKKQTPEKKDKGSLFSLLSSKTNTQNKDDVDQRPKLYKCFCGLHFTSLNAIERHYKSKNCNTVTREKCSQCNLLFDPIEVVNHLCKHHAQNQTKSFNIVTPNKKTLYKCSLCHVLFYNKISAFPHKAKCTGQFCGKKCEKCGLAFDASSLAIHMVDHERNNKLRNDCYVIVEIPDATLPEIETGLHPNVIYKCKSCDIHFLRRTSARNHMTKLTDCGSTATETCKICKRKFPVKSIMRHIAWQHKKYKVKEFDVRELTFRVNSKMPKVIKKAETVKPEEKTRKLKTEEVIPKKETVSSTVYRCVKCMLLFTDESTLLTHLEDRCSKELTDECEECSVKFASKNIKEHNRQHGPGVAVSLNIIDDVQACEIPDNETKLSPTPFDPKQHPLYKCLGCNLHYLNKSTLSSHDCNPSAIVNCEICELSFTKRVSTVTRLFTRNII
ncbi:zinc finger protein 91-like [Leguminivora glycinivorella]|uniref:zinc finger protein 91-like n=1 Tax=Leguminivora glycinivorella TaxID=1035111 RepID=UPI00200F1C7A|nr:zinc finger protein 91-like [Leguminivora glycinivorella]